MEYDGKKWRLVDDPICDVAEWQSVPADCRECELFYDCYEIADDNYQILNLTKALTHAIISTSKGQSPKRKEMIL